MSASNSQTADVKVVCTECRGTGGITVRHFNKYEAYYCYTEYVQCDKCKGEGYGPAD